MLFILMAKQHNFTELRDQFNKLGIEYFKAELIREKIGDSGSSRSSKNTVGLHFKIDRGFSDFHIAKDLTRTLTNMTGIQFAALRTFTHNPRGQAPTQKRKEKFYVSARVSETDSELSRTLLTRGSRLKEIVDFKIQEDATRRQIRGDSWVLRTIDKRLDTNLGLILQERERGRITLTEMQSLHEKTRTTLTRIETSLGKPETSRR